MYRVVAVVDRECIHYTAYLTHAQRSLDCYTGQSSDPEKRIVDLDTEKLILVSQCSKVMEVSNCLTHIQTQF